MDGWLWYSRAPGEFATGQAEFMHALCYAIPYHCCWL